MFDTYIRNPVRKVLLWLLHWTDKVPSKPEPVRRTVQKFWQKEIHLPASLIAVLSIMTLFMILLFQVGVSEAGVAWLKVSGLGLFLVMMFVFLAIYLHDERPELLADSEAMMLLSLLYISAVLVMDLVDGWVSPLAIPVSAFVILAGLLLSRSLALMVGISLSLILGVMNRFRMEYFFVHFFGSMMGVVLLSHVRNRRNVMSLGFKIAATNAMAILIIHLFVVWPLSTLGKNMAWGVVSGVVSSILVLSFLPYLESFFSRTTNIKLLELADFNQPLLKRLMLEAPGTYHHSLIMASVAEHAAAAIGANSLLARVGAYYHDIGKLSNPEYFIENQQTMGNPHDPLTPTMSSLIVISHVKEGVALARKYKLDRVIIDCIEQHHGTSLIHYFYHRALEQNGETKSEDFRYPGPKPKSKETAILMLADAVEAACRTIDEPSPSRIRDMVEKVINNKFTDGQFSKCPITLHDLSTIAESMVSTLNAIYHARVEYQKTREQE